MSIFPSISESPQAVISTVSAEGVGPSITPFSSTYSAAVWPSANLAFFVPIRLGASFTSTKIFWLNGATVGTNNVDVGVYDSQGNQLAHTGNTLTSGASAVQSVTLAVTLLPGLYYLAMVMDGTTDTVQRKSISTTTAVPRAVGILTQTTASPLPSTATMVGSTTASFIPYIGLTGASTI